MRPFRPARDWTEGSKNLRTQLGLSVRGSECRVAEREDGVVVVPHPREVAEDAAEVVERVPIHSRDAEVPRDVERETLLHIERRVPEALGQLATVRLDDLDPLSSDEVRVESCEVCQVFLARGRSVDDLLVGANPQLIAGLQNPRRVRKAHAREFRHGLVVRRHRDDAEVRKQPELLEGLCWRFGLRRDADDPATRQHEARRVRIAGLLADVIEPLNVVQCDLPFANFLELVDLQTSQFGRVCADDCAHRFSFM